MNAPGDSLTARELRFALLILVVGTAAGAVGPMGGAGRWPVVLLVSVASILVSFLVHLAVLALFRVAKGRREAAALWATVPPDGGHMAQVGIAGLVFVPFEIIIMVVLIKVRAKLATGPAVLVALAGRAAALGVSYWLRPVLKALFR